MIRFLVKTAFLVTVGVMLIPTLEGVREKDHTSFDLWGTLGGAQAALNDASGFCERAPSACAAGSHLAGYAADRVEEGLVLALDFAHRQTTEGGLQRIAGEPDGAQADRPHHPGDLAVSAPPVEVAERAAETPKVDTITTAATSSRGVRAASPVSVPVPDAPGSGVSGRPAAFIPVPSPAPGR